MERVLYSYWRSSAAYRLRIALNLKGLSYEQKIINLVKGEQHSEAYHLLNPAGLLPTLVDGESTLGQSLAVLEYLEEEHPEPALLPSGAADRARVRQLALTVACEVHPLNNLSILKYLKGELGVDDEAKLGWYRHWVGRGFTAMETILGDGKAGRFCHGDTPGFADICLVPQMYNARRFDCDLDPFPRLRAIDAACRELDAFAAAAPENQPDAV